MKTVLVLKCVDKDMRSHGGFKWPKRGRVIASDWKPTIACGNGLHGWLWGVGDHTASEYSENSDSKWLVVCVLENEIIDLNGKVKFPRGTVVFCGERSEAANYVRARTPMDVRDKVMWSTATAGDRGTATAGYGGTATAGDSGIASAGDGGTATAGYRGTATAGYRGTATAGDRGIASAGDYGTATAGDCGTATAGDCGTATAGDCGTATAGDRGIATAGDSGTATAGNGGTIIISYYVNRKRIVVGYIGENGIEPNVAYRVSEGKLIRA